MRQKFQLGNIALIGIVSVAVIALIGFFILSRQNKSTLPPGNQPPVTEEKMTNGKFSFSTPKKSAHYESNTPEHAAVLAGVPINVVVNVNFDLTNKSSIFITKDGKDFGVGTTALDSNKLTMRRNIDPNSPDGVYTVNYKACWPDGSCHDGTFQFAIDRNRSQQFENLTGKKEATIKMSEIAFKPINITVDKGTKVTWINDDSVVHYVNTDSHPAHTYEPDQNSKALAQNQSYSYTFEKAGIYPYHCSAHAGVMTGTILVE